jgi:hypothetical protein
MEEFEFAPAKQEEFLEKIREGVMRGAAATELALDRFEVRKYISEHPEFEARIEDAEVDATEHVKEALYGAAVSGSVPAAKAWLEMNGEEFAERRGRPANPKPTGPFDPFADLGPGVVSIDSRRQNGA